MSDECPDCGGETEMELVGQHLDEVCQQCGLILESEEVVEQGEPESPEGEVEEV